VTDQRTDIDSTVQGEMGESTEGSVTPEPGDASELALLQQQLDETRILADEYLDQWRRATAEFSNYKKRTDRERVEFQKSATTGFIMRLLPAIDDFDRAFDNLPHDLVGHDWVSGIQMVRQKMHALLDQEGVEPIVCAGEMFDPVLHEAVTYEESDDHAEGQVIDVLESGYRVGERILRPAKVRVAK
jgi:molecular chaperone GrpE